jgi:hypothetical protein
MREHVIRVLKKYIDAVRKGLAEFFRILKSIEVVRLTTDDETCAAVFKIDTALGLIPFLEFFHAWKGTSYPSALTTIHVRFCKV